VTLLDFWPTPESVAALVPPPTDAAFVAVHRPALLTRRETGEPADERALLDALSEPGVVTVVGPAGSGKSHLLRWLERHLAGVRRVVRVGPGTDPSELPAGPPAESGGPSGALRARADAARAECDAAVGRGEPPDPKARALAEIHAPGILLLLEGSLKDEFPPTGPDGQYLPADFEFRNVPSHKIADPKLMRYVQKLKTNVQGERTAAAELLNEVRAEPRTPASPPDVVYLVDGVPESEEVRRAVRADGGRAVVAVSDEESDGLVGPVFDLAGLLSDFVGAYLKAARPALDEAELSDADRAVLESFGRDRSGVPLFPLRGLPTDPVNPRAFLTDFVLPALTQSPESVLPSPEPEPVPEPEPIPEPEPVATPDPFAWRRELHAVLNALLDMEAERVNALRRLTAVLMAESAPDPDAEVEAFRAAADSPDGAPLALVTPAVKAWLAATDLLEKYRVRP
jgi:hypothetical protein